MTDRELLEKVRADLDWPGIRWAYPEDLLPTK
jgi:hypothetical protein